MIDRLVLGASYERTRKRQRVRVIVSLFFHFCTRQTGEAAEGGRLFDNLQFAGLATRKRLLTMV